MLIELTREAVNAVVVPILLVLASSIVLVAKKYIKRITDSIIAKNDINIILSNMRIKNSILEELGTLVQSAVFTNMKLANTLKESKTGGERLTDVEVTMLQESAKKIVYNALPDDYTSDASAVLELIGGKDKLDNIIGSMIEGAVIEAKSKMK